MKYLLRKIIIILVTVFAVGFGAAEVADTGPAPTPTPTPMPIVTPAPTPTPFQWEEADSYADVVRQALEEKEAYGAGGLYDLDGDGKKELMMQHRVWLTVPRDGEQRQVPFSQCSVFTKTKDGVQMVLSQPIYEEMSGNQGYIAASLSNGKPYLYIYKYTDLNIDEETYTLCQDERTYYRISGTDVEVADYGMDIYENYGADDKKYLEARINQTETSIVELDEYMSKYKEVYYIYPNFDVVRNFENPDAKHLEDLAAYLEKKGM